jgi:hypothetical protein
MHRPDHKIFQIIDSKERCNNIYYDNKIVSDPNFNELSGTWSYDLRLNNDIEFAELYSNGKSLTECCPESLKEDWEKIKERHFSFIKSFQTSNVQIQDYCHYDLLPKSFVIEYFKIKSEITKHVLNNYSKPNNYDFLFELSKLLKQIESNELSLNLNLMNDDLHQLKVRNLKQKLSRVSKKVSYNLFGTITGRLTTKKNSFPILTLDKDYRKVVQPQNDWFIELDFNSAELRCMLSLNKKNQPEIDIHDWHTKIINNLSDHKMDRDEVKRKMFAWMYGPADASLGIPKIESYYDKKNIINNFWDGTKITNPFGRQIESDKFHALNFIVQSTTSDTFLRRAIAVNKLLEKRKSFTMGLIHDSMVIDFDKNDRDILEDLIEEFSNTDLGKFKVNTSLGTNFGNMRKFR